MSLDRREVVRAGAAAAVAPSMSGAAYPSAGGAVNAPTLYVDVGGRRLAYRSVGEGRPLVLLNRFRGVLDTWDPAFIDGLATGGFRVITFDYSGLGLSTGERSYSPASLVKDARELITALGLKSPAIGGWSIGGIAAQIYFAMFGAEVSHLILLATTPPGRLVKTAEQLFFDTTAKPGVDLDQFTTVFFEPSDSASRVASKASFDRIMARTVDRSPNVDAAWAVAQIGNTPRNPVFPSDDVLKLLKSTKTPILHIGGDHDIIFPVENWYALNGEMPTTRLLTFPKAGHGPHHQYPQEAAGAIATFIKA